MSAKRLGAVVGGVAVLAAGVVVLGNSRSAEGPGHGSVTAVAAPKKDGPKGPPPVPVLAATVVNRNMRQTLEISGSLKTDEDVHIGSRIAGKVVEVTVKEGDRVRPGQLLVRLDDREVRAQIARARGQLAAARAKLSLARNQATWNDTKAVSDHDRMKANLEAAKARLQQAETNQRLIEFETKTKVETAQSGVRVATERLSIARELTRKQELQQAQLAVDRAEAHLSQAKVDLDNAQRFVERRRTLFSKDAIPKEEVEEAERRFKAQQANVRVAEAALAVAKQSLSLSREGSRPEEVRMAEEQLRTAQHNLEQSKQDLERREVAKKEVETARSGVEQAQALLRAAEAALVQPKISAEEVAAAQAAVEQSRADISFYETQLADLVIRSPIAGVVSTRQVNTGETITTSSVLMNLVALDTVFLEALVPELEVGALRTGNRAAVTIDAQPGRKYGGMIREIIPVAERTSKSFRVRIAVSGAGKELPPGAYARARVAVGVHPNSVAVRKDAVSTEAGDKFVWLIEEQDDGSYRAKRQVVTVGLVDDQFVQVLSGLEPGDRVITAGSPAIIEGTPVMLQPTSATSVVAQKPAAGAH